MQVHVTTSSMSIQLYDYINVSLSGYSISENGRMDVCPLYRLCLSIPLIEYIYMYIYTYCYLPPCLRKCLWPVVCSLRPGTEQLFLVCRTTARCLRPTHTSLNAKGSINTITTKRQAADSAVSKNVARGWLHKCQS